MQTYVHKSTDNGAMSQLDSVLTQMREKARSAKEWTATTTPELDAKGEPTGNLTFTLAIEAKPKPQPKG